MHISALTVIIESQVLLDSLFSVGITVLFMLKTDMTSTKGRQALALGGLQPKFGGGANLWA